MRGPPPITSSCWKASGTHSPSSASCVGTGCPRIAVIGLRGATSGRKLLLHAINPRAQLFAIVGSDGAGAKCFQEKGLLDLLHERVRVITALWPNTEKSDLNDLVKSGELDRDTLLSVIQPLMIHPRPKPRPPTFAKWSQAHKKDPEPTGPTATFV